MYSTWMYSESTLLQASMIITCRSTTLLNCNLFLYTSLARWPQTFSIMFKSVYLVSSQWIWCHVYLETPGCDETYGLRCCAVATPRRQTAASLLQVSIPFLAPECSTLSPTFHLHLPYQLSRFTKLIPKPSQTFLLVPTLNTTQVFVDVVPVKQ